MKKTNRPRGRPRTFDTEVAMRAIVETFRERGYAATSLDDLSQATGLSRPSLYAAYGDKLSMYLSAIDAFSTAAAEQAIDALVGGTTVETSLRDFYGAMLDVYYGAETAASGCLVYGTAPSTTYEEQVRQRLADSIDELDRAMLRRLRDLGVEGSAEIRAAAEAAANTLIGLSVRVRSGASKRTLSAQARRSARLIGSVLQHSGPTKQPRS